MSVYLQDSKILLNSGEVATSGDCCCGGCPCQPTSVDASYSGTTPIAAPCDSFSYFEHFDIPPLDPTSFCVGAFFGTVHEIVCDAFLTIEIQLNLSVVYNSGTNQWEFIFELDIAPSGGGATEVGLVRYNFDCPPQTVNQDFGEWLPFPGYAGHLNATIS